MRGGCWQHFHVLNSSLWCTHNTRRSASTGPLSKLLYSFTAIAGTLRCIYILPAYIDFCSLGKNNYHHQIALPNISVSICIIRPTLCNAHFFIYMLFCAVTCCVSGYVCTRITFSFKPDLSLIYIAFFSNTNALLTSAYINLISFFFFYLAETYR